MIKIGGILLIFIGIVLISLAVLRAIDVVTIFMHEGGSAYGGGFIAGTAVMLILLSFFGIKSLKKGRALMSSAEQEPHEQ